MCLITKNIEAHPLNRMKNSQAQAKAQIVDY